ncbi:conserved hypothetical protein [Vibrio crassostreae]|nr:conserved hypothetical protein [Vibrio crassostreae]
MKRMTRLAFRTNWWINIVNKKIFVGIIILGFVSGVYLQLQLVSYNLLPGQYKSEVSSFFETRNIYNLVHMERFAELEISENFTYEYMTLTKNNTGVFTSGTYFNEENKLDLIEEKHNYFQDVHNDELPFWEKVIVQPKVFSTQGLTVVPIGGIGFLLFDSYSASLMKRVR